MIAEQIRKLLEAKAEALIRKAGDDLSALIHPDFIYVNARGMSFDKASYVENFCLSGEILFKRQEIAGLRVREFPGFAVATMVLNEAFHFEGQDTTASYRSLCVFSKMTERWLWAAGQTMAMPGS
jgi:hypothetical protein